MSGCSDTRAADVSSRLTLADLGLSKLSFSRIREFDGRWATVRNRCYSNEGKVSRGLRTESIHHW
jgi:hypothetical protein